METSAKPQKKRGPKPDPTKAMVRSMFDAWSTRTFETYWSGHKLLISLEREGYVDHDGRVALAQDINDRIVRPNGTFSVARYERECAEAYIKVVEAYASEHDEAPALPDERGPVISGSASATSTLEDGS